MSLPPATDVFLLGTHFCGSTLLGTALNQQPGVVYAGELGLLPGHAARLMGQQLDWRTVCLACGLAGQECDLWTPGFREACEAAGPGGVHALVRERTGAPLVVDGTKAPSWFRLCLAERSPHLPPPKVVIAARHPYAYLASAKRYLGHGVLVSANQWRDVYWDALCACTALGIDFLVLRHEDFMGRRVEAVRRLGQFLGFEPVPEMVGETYAGNLCSLGGNPGVGAAGRRPEEAKPDVPGVWKHHHERKGHGALDQRWKSELTQGEIEEAGYAAGLADAAVLLGYNLTALAREYTESRK
jgi:hypothetical protein